jgi:hypothetical protein
MIRLQLWQPIEHQHSSTPLTPDVNKQKKAIKKK